MLMLMYSGKIFPIQETLYIKLLCKNYLTNCQLTVASLMKYAIILFIYEIYGMGTKKHKLDLALDNGKHNR